MSTSQNMRVATSEYMRCTNQTAITMFTRMGRRIDRAEVIRQQATRCMLGALRGVCLNSHIKLLDSYEGGARDAFDQYMSMKTNKKRVPATPPDNQIIPSLEADLIVTPIDGASALRDGRSGSLSIIAFGDPGSFAIGEQGGGVDLQEWKKSFFLISLGREVLSILNMNEQDLAATAKTLAGKTTSDMSLDSYLTAHDGIINIVMRGLHQAGKYAPTIGSTIEGANTFGPWKPALHIPTPHVNRNLPGSAVACCIAAQLGKVSIGMCLGRTTQTYQAAVAARSLGGLLLAIPVRPSQLPRGRKAALNHNTNTTDRTNNNPSPSPLICLDKPIRNAHDLVPGNHAGLIMTSISEVCIMDRVRFTPQNGVTYQSLLMNIASESLRDFKHSVNITKAHMRHHDGTEDKAINVLNKYQKEFGLISDV